MKLVCRVQGRARLMKAQGWSFDVDGYGGVEVVVEEAVGERTDKLVLAGGLGDVETTESPLDRACSAQGGGGEGGGPKGWREEEERARCAIGDGEFGVLELPMPSSID
ncbi:uncharacterized protein A4U43_C08F13810 [Asparagus officinalis]|nr:uncharacterized protein A4U43_C08F13810 [Asparagus officinalis]